MTHPTDYIPNKWAQFSDAQLRGMVGRHHRQFGTMELERMKCEDMLDILKHKESPLPVARSFPSSSSDGESGCPVG